MENKLPPLHNPFTVPYVSIQHDDRKEPQIIFMSHDLSKRIRIELDKRNMTLEEFVAQACIEYIKIIDGEHHSAIQSDSAAQSTSDAFVSVSLNSSNEDKELAEQMINLHKLGAFNKHKKDADHEPLIKQKKRTSKDKKHYDKK